MRISEARFLYQRFLERISPRERQERGRGSRKGRHSGENTAEDIIEQIVSSRLLGTSVDGAEGVLLCISTGSSVELEKIEKIATAVSKRAVENANIIFGMDFDESMGDGIKAVLIATSRA